MTSRLWLALGALTLLAALVLFTLPGVFEPAPPGSGRAPPPEAPPPPTEPAGTSAPDAGSALEVEAETSAGDGSPSVQPEMPRRSLAWLLDALQNAPQFRVRLQAVSALGRMRNKGTTDALIGALADPHAAVRRAAIDALTRRRGANVVAALRRAEAGERDAKVRGALARALAKLAPAPSAPKPASAAGPRYYVGVGDIAGSGLSPALRSRVDAMVRSGVRAIGGATLAPRGESSGAARAVLKGQSRSGLFLDVSVGAPTHDTRGTGASVSIVVGSYPGRDMRAIVNGKATLPGGTGSDADRDKAVEGAVRSALRKLPATFARVAR